MGPDSYIGSIGQFAGSYDPLNWIACEGQTLNISEYGDLYNIIRNRWGATVETFNLPDYRPVSPEGARIDWDQAGVPRICICYAGLYPQANTGNSKPL